MKLPAIILLILTAFLASCYGAQQTINIGTTPSDGTGDTLRTAFGKVNTNFTELYSLTSAINASNITTGTLPMARIADGSLTNAKLLNSSVTINGTAVSLGGSISIASAANLTGLTDVTITSAATNDFLVKSAGDWVNLTPASARTALGLSSAGGVLSGTYPSPGFAVDMAEQTELTNGLATKEDTQTAASQAEAEAGSLSSIRKWSPLRIKQAVTALAPSGLGVNVKKYGALGDAQKVTDAASTNGSTTVTSASGRFAAGDVGKVIWAVNTSTKALAVPLGTITGYTSASQITVSNAATASATGLHLVWGTDDTDAIQAAHAAAKAVQPRGLVEVPAGGYIFDELLFDLTETEVTKSGGILGAGSGSTIFYPSPGHDLAADSMLAKTSGNNYYTRLEGFAVDGSYYQWSASGKSVVTLGGFIMEGMRDVRIEFLYGTTNGIGCTGYFTNLERVYIESLGYVGLSVDAGGSIFVSDSLFANCGLFSVQLSSVAGTANLKSFARFQNSWMDESGQGCMYITGSTDVVLQGVRFSAPNGYAGLIITGSSNVRAVGCELLPWGTDGNRPGASVASGSTLWATGCRFDATGTANGLTNAGTAYLSQCRLAALGSGVGLNNSGTYNDDGTNIVASVTNTGTRSPFAAAEISVASNVLRLYSDGNGNISSTGAIALRPASGSPVYSSSHLQFLSDATHDIGGSATTFRPRDLWLSRSANSPLFKSANASGTNTAANNVTLGGSTSTGTGAGGDVISITSMSGSSGSTANATQERSRIIGRFIDLTESAASTLSTISLPSGKVTGGTATCTVWASDGTDHQALTSEVRFSAINKAGTVTATLSQTDGTTAASAGTLTVTYTASASGNNVLLRANATSSLTQTVLRSRLVITAINGDDAQAVTPP